MKPGVAHCVYALYASPDLEDWSVEVPAAPLAEGDLDDDGAFSFTVETGADARFWKATGEDATY